MRGECIRTEAQKYKEYLGLYKNYSGELIKKKLKINEKLLHKFLTKAILKNRTEGSKQIIFTENIPFSKDEMDYGDILVWPKKLINIALNKAEPTELTIAIRKYKLLFNKKIYGRDVEHAY